MKKTLKLLMAIALVVVMLSIATTVNAALADLDLTGSVTYSNFKNNGGVNDDGEVQTGAAMTGTLVINENAEIDLKGISIANFEIQSGKTLTLKNSSTTEVAITKIDNEGTLVVDSDKITVATLNNEGTATLKAAATTVNNEAGSLTVDSEVGTVDMKAGTLELGDAAEITTLKTAVNLSLNKGTEIGTINTTAANVVVTIAANSTLLDTVPTAAGEATALETLDGTTYFANKADITYTVELKDKNGNKATDFTAGKEYAVIIKAKLDGKVLAGETGFSIAANANGDKIVEEVASISVVDEGTFKGIKFVKDLGENEIVLRPTFTPEVAGTPGTQIVDNTKTLTIPEAAQKPEESNKPEETDKPEESNKPEETNKPEEDNKGELDETPKTGDHIIPATAVLAVVVVANVVYFAKMKRN